MTTVIGELFEEDMQEYNMACLPSLVAFPPLQRVIAAAYNYRGYQNISETDPEEPVLFLKTLTSICSPGDLIRIPAGVDLVWPEVELAFVVHKVCKSIHAGVADDYILGYTVANDVTAKNIHGRDDHLLRSKGLDTFCPMLPYLRTDIDVSALSMRTTVNGTDVQKGNTRDLLWPPRELLALLSNFITLLPGDVVLTGTPPHSHYRLEDGDEVEVYIEELGGFTNSVQKTRTQSTEGQA
jgi:2-keto-4-pentenoate hydratase/2-oxohepta-3-ene-1,7-dioic acid hydratase in catechol pathway